MEPNTISILGLDDDEEWLHLIAKKFDANNIGNYAFVYSEKEFFKNFDNNVHIAIIDHFINGEIRGFDIMEKILLHNKQRNAIIKCRVIIISGQHDQRVIRKYWHKGAKGYIGKDEPEFFDLLVEYVKRNQEEVDDILSYMEGQKNFFEKNTICKNE